MDHHTVAAISIAGTFFDLLGSLYLAYDLLGGQHGPLRLLTRAVTYSVVFGVGYGIGLGLFFGLASGLATGLTISIELKRRAARQFAALLFALGGDYRSARSEECLAWRWTISDSSASNNSNRIRHPHHHRSNIRLFARHAAHRSTM